ncbi:hypothetical protein ZWY2020_056730 [Hordeum vulgare]|nr:hypothetical protein ZWY2020_056730 [Hordeum vulgare]
MACSMAHPSTWVGDHSVRPEVFSVIQNTAVLQAEAALLESNDMVAWFDRDRRASINEDTMNAIGSGCSLDYVELASKLKTETKVLALWAWNPFPSKVPHVKMITFPACNGRASIYERRGLKHRVLVHLDIHEDPSSGKVVSETNDWRSNIVE